MTLWAIRRHRNYSAASAFMNCVSFGLSSQASSQLKTSNDLTDARHGHDPSTTAITLRQSLDLVGYGFNSFIELPPVTGKISNDAYHAR